jgi:predicted ATPase
MAKFDQMKQSRPFSILSEAFEQYCDILICQQDCDWAKLVVTELYVAIGPDICDLAKVIPKLGELMNIGTEFDESIANQNCGNAMQRFHYLLCQFVEVIATHSPTSLVFCVDDLQWADDASLAVLGRIMKQKQHRCFFLGCYRGDEMKEDHSFWKMLASVNAVGVNTTHVKLSCMCHEEVNEVISDLLCLSPRLVRPLSQILYMKTNGNVLFFVQLLLSLYHDGLLHLDFKKQRWTWDEEKILSMKLPDNIAIWFTLSIGKLPVEVQLALHVVSMFGASIQLGIVKALESQLGLKLVEPLKIAAKNGFVTELNDSHRFTHDRIQEASYNLIGERDRRCNHLTYGKFLVELAQETNDGDLLFIAVSQINHGGPDVVSEPADYVAIARHNLAAGKRAMSTADFSTAYSFFENGISFLPINHWQDHYDLSLEMFNLCAKCALASGHLRAIHSLSFHVLENTKNNFHDTLDVQFTNLSLLALTSKMGEALQLGLTVISKLGEGIPIDPSNELIQQQATKIQNMISGVSEEQLLNYKVMDNSSKSDAMMFLARLQVIAWMISSPVHPLIILKMMEITITWGKFLIYPQFYEWNKLTV